MYKPLSLCGELFCYSKTVLGMISWKIRLSIYMKLCFRTLHPLHLAGNPVSEKGPFHRWVNRVKGLEANFYVYTRARESGKVWK